MDSLKPCPFCGNAPTWLAGSDSDAWACLTCKFCGVELDEQGAGCMARAAEKWNRRVPTSEGD